MYGILEKSNSYRLHIAWIGAVFLLLILGISVLSSHRLSQRIASPLRLIAKKLANHHQLGGELTLPNSQTLEVDFLSRELTDLWQRLVELKKIDVTELANRQEKLLTILACIDDAVMVLDLDGRILHCNAGMYEILMHDSALNSLVGKRFDDLDFVSDHNQCLRQAVNCPPPLTPNLTVKLRGAQHVYEIRVRPIVNQNAAIGKVVLLHDVTEIGMRERLKREFIGVLSHELKTPLQSLSTAAELLTQEKMLLPENKRFLLETINEDLLRIRAVAQDFFQVSMGEVHSLNLRLEKVSLGVALKNWLKPFQMMAQERNIQFELEGLDDVSLCTNIDQIKFPWVLSNLLSNSLRFTPKDGRITVQLRRIDNQLSLQISDSGPGIPLGLEQKVFEPYFQAASDVATAGRGFLGLGLTVAREVVNAHGGEIHCTSKLPHGALFEVHLPMANA